MEEYSKLREQPAARERKRERGSLFQWWTGMRNVSRWAANAKSMGKSVIAADSNIRLRGIGREQKGGGYIRLEGQHCVCILAPRGPEVRVIHASLHDFTRSWLVRWKNLKSGRIDTLPLPHTHRHRENLPPTLPFSDEKKRKRKRKGKNRHRWRRRFTCSSDGSREGMKFPIRTLAANFSRVDV